MMFDIVSLNYIAKGGSVESKQEWAEDGSLGSLTLTGVGKQAISCILCLRPDR